jgi:hypothetical protein
MAYYLVRAWPRQELLPDLEGGLCAGAFLRLKPFGWVLSASLRDARLTPDGRAWWEEADYCRPPLAQERAMVRDRYFADLAVEPVDEGAGWRRTAALPRLFPALAVPVAAGTGSGLEQR